MPNTPIVWTAHPGEGPIRPRLTRCECQNCGAHSNAVAARRVHGSCPNCGSTQLVPVQGADVIRPARRR